VRAATVVDQERMKMQLVATQLAAIARSLDITASATTRRDRLFILLRRREVVKAVTLTESKSHLC
jgi:hypothetical protein